MDELVIEVIVDCSYIYIALFINFSSTGLPREDLFVVVMEKYENLGMIGEGSYGMVMKCRHKVRVCVMYTMCKPQ